MSIHDRMVGNSPGFQQVRRTAQSVAGCNSNILVTGESGTGKEVIARAIHEWSPRSQKPFIPINCSAIPENLLESELFGYARGAFTGAHVTKTGLFEEAEGGTLFLDEIGDMAWGLQAKLLRVLQERKIKRIGENQYRDVDIRIVAATHEHLKTAVLQRRFREDLYFRLNVIPIEIPSLRQRREDILPLAHFFLQKYSAINDKASLRLTAEAEEFLLEQAWPGNVRELENAMERVAVLAHGTNQITADDLDFLAEYRIGSAPESSFNFEEQFQGDQKILPMEEMTQKYIQYVLALNKGAKNKTARELGIDRKTLYRKLHNP
jgi:transcriptional regulator with PAS, ATPase and Fis domain